MKTNSPEHLPPYRVRPRFQVATLLTVEQIVTKIKNGLEAEDALCMGWVHPSGHGRLMVLQAAQHYWSPQLTLTIESTGNGSVLHGLYGPRESVWTLFIFIYFLIAFATVVLSVIGLSNLFLQKSAMVLWLVPVLVLVFCTLYLVSYTGQKLGHEQMVTLHDFLEESLGMVIGGEE